ncbi:MAG: hypothetical protein ACRD8W_27580 [Nitrososphaeraceae archaeon]
MGSGHGIITSSESNNKVAWNAYDLGRRINNSTYVFKGIIFFDVLPSHDGSNELMLMMVLGSITAKLRILEAQGIWTWN